jgi:hypothetical protein
VIGRPSDLIAATRDFEQWMARQTPVVRADLRYKHRRMEENPFVFLRATYYRWVQLWAAVLPKVARAPRVSSVGDLHMENFGTWRDAEGRLVWGVNDFDEAHPAPYTNDLVRLATSVLLAARLKQFQVAARGACDAILDGYETTLTRGGRPVVLAERRRWLRNIAVAQLKDPATFWRKLLANTTTMGRALPAALARAALPDRRLEYLVRRRRAGAGSLGRPRFVVIANVGGGYIARELKTAIPSAVVWASNGREPGSDVSRLLGRAVRVADPYYRLTKRWVIRRLAPDCTKLDIHLLTLPGDQSRLLRAMGSEVANIHLASQTRAVLADLHGRPTRWLHEAAAEMAEVTVSEWKAWRQR